MDSKTVLTTNGLILEFLVGILLFFVDFISTRTEICVIAQVCFSFDEIKSFWRLVWGVFLSVLRVCPFFSAIDFSNVAWDLSMQSIFTSYNRVSSSVSFVASIDKITISSSENHKDRFPRFSYVNCLLIFYSVYCNNCSFKNNNRAFYCNCSSVAPLMPEFFLWLTETRKNLNIVSCINISDVVLKYCLDNKEGNWLHYSLTSLCWWIK